MPADRVQCLLCPHLCGMDPGERGTCGVRMNLSGELVSLVYGLPVAANADPIEKKPLFHFRPGSKSFSIACAGCNLGCLGCQNWEISQALPEDIPPLTMPPAQVVESALDQGCSSISYTYTEPLMAFEYVLDTASAAREAGLANVLVSAGYANEGPLRELAPLLDAANIDLKGATDSFYRRMCFATLQPVVRCLEILHECGVWLEVTNLVVPGWNDTEEDISALVTLFKGAVGRDVPLHFSRFFPMYRLADLAPTPASTIAMARETALSAGVSFVYAGNLSLQGGSDTICPHCGAVLVTRHGYTVTIDRAAPECPECSGAVPGVWNERGL